MATEPYSAHEPNPEDNAASSPGARPQSGRLLRVLGRSWKWGLAAVAAGLLVYRVKFAPTPVAVHSVQAGAIVAEVLGTGTLEARVKTTLSSRLQERLAEVLVDQGDWVRSGQLLARLDEGELKRQVEVAEAAGAAARATLERVKTDRARALAVVKQARLNHQRVSELQATKVTSADELDKAVEALQIAEADRERSEAAIAEAESQVVTAERNLAYQKERLSYTQVLSPYDGLVVRRDRDPGGVAVPGASLLQIVSTNEIWVSAWVDETAMAGLATGQTARVVFRSEPNRSYPGTVARLAHETDRETREFLVDVRVRELPKVWTIGQRAEVYIETGRKANALPIPPRFVRWRDQQAGVFVAQGGRARWRPVTLGLRGRDLLEIAQGLQAGDVVVAPRDVKQPPLTEGQRIGTP